MSIAANPIVEGRSCGTCTLCCKVMEITELNKPGDSWCPHCEPGHSCRIYENRPEECRTFYCGYLTIPALDERWKPRRSRIIVHVKEDGKQITVHVDPERPDAWREEPYYSLLKEWAGRGVKNGERIVVRVGSRFHVIFPDRDVDLGPVGDDEVIFTGERQTPTGKKLGAFVLKKDDPRLKGLAAPQEVSPEGTGSAEPVDV
jgi:hypothetical protein